MAAKKPSAPINVKLSGRHRDRLDDIAAAHGGLPPGVVVAAGLYALAELSKRERVRVIVACVEGEPVIPRRTGRRGAGRRT
ncbi:MAG TPA: hypothetical protein VGL81_32050 [Polyangiaceae bacterium]